MDNYLCQICQKGFKTLNGFNWHVDHIHPETSPRKEVPSYKINDLNILDHVYAPDILVSDEL